MYTYGCDASSTQSQLENVVVHFHHTRMEVCIEATPTISEPRDGNSNELREDIGSEECTLDRLPFEIIILILARVPRSAHKSVRATCRSWAQVLRGTEVYELRRAAGLQEDWLYVLAGARGSHSLRLEGFDPLEETAPPMPSEISMHPNPPPANLWGCHVAALGYEIFVLGGSGGIDVTIPLASVWSYDVRTKKWRTRAPMLSARCGFACAVLEGGIQSEGHRGLVVAGGWGGDRVPLNSAELYDPDTDTWRTLAPMTRHRGECQAAVFAGKVHVIGGIDKRRSGNTTTTLTLICGEVLTLTKGDVTTAPPPHTTIKPLSENGYPERGGLENIESVDSGKNMSGEDSDESLDDAWLAPLPGWVMDGGREEAGKVDLVIGSVWERVDCMWRNISLPGSLVVLPGEGREGREGRLLGVADIANSIQEYDPQSNSWQAVISVPNPQRGFQLATLNGGLLLLGVYGGNWIVPQRQPHAPTGVWSGLALLHNEAHGVTALAL